MVSKRNAMRQILNENCGYGKPEITTQELFDLLDRDIAKRRDYCNVMGLLHRDRADFHDGELDDALKRLKKDSQKYNRQPNKSQLQTVYECCLNEWKEMGRTFLYYDKETLTWGTPKTLTKKGRLDENILNKSISAILSKSYQMRKLGEEMPYKKAFGMVEYIYYTEQLEDKKDVIDKKLDKLKRMKGILREEDNNSN